MEILNLILPYLNQLGPWGVLIGIGLKIVFDRVRSRNSDPQRPLIDAFLAVLKQPEPPPPPPAPTIPDEHRRPLLDLFLKALSERKK